MYCESYGVYENQFSHEEVIALVTTLGADAPIRAGVRNILDLPAVLPIVRSEQIRALVARYLSDSAVCVRGILFDKTQESNWNLPFHQDTKIAIKKRGSSPGYSQYREKDGVLHVCPPATVLARQIAVRIHLDPCSANSGPVRIIPDSDRYGVLEQEQIGRLITQTSPIDCAGGEGSVLVFRSLLLHGSDRSTSPLRRRVLHLEFCDAQLHSSIEWNWCITLYP